MRSNKFDEYKDIKNLFNLLREQDEDGSSADIEQESIDRGETFTLTNDNDFFKEQSSRIRELSKGVMITFNPISIDYNLNNFEWSLKVNGNLEIILKVSNDDSGMFISSDNLKTDEASVKALVRIQGYFREELLTTVTERLSSKDF